MPVTNISASSGELSVATTQADFALIRAKLGPIVRIAGEISFRAVCGGIVSGTIEVKDVKKLRIVRGVRVKTVREDFATRVLVSVAEASVTDVPIIVTEDFNTKLCFIVLLCFMLKMAKIGVVVSGAGLFSFSKAVKDAGEVSVVIRTSNEKVLQIRVSAKDPKIFFPRISVRFEIVSDLRPIGADFERTQNREIF